MIAPRRFLFRVAAPRRSRNGRARLACLIALVLLAVAPTAADAAVFDPKSFTLSNGMRVLLIENRRAPVVSHMVWYKVGAADEPAGKSGIAHLLEHLMFKGTETQPSGAFSKTVARLGGTENAFTARDYTAYFQNVAAEHLETVMRLEADRMRNLVLSDAEVAAERDVVLEERRSRTDNSPRALLAEQVAAALYLNHPYGRPIIGWAHEIRALTKADALEFYRRHYVPANAILIVAGDVTLDALRVLAEKYYGAIPARPAPERARLREPPHGAARRVLRRDSRVREPSWSRSYLAPGRRLGGNARADALEVLAEILGGSATGPLYRRLVVEEKAAVAADAYYDGDAFDQTRFVIYARPAPGVSVERVESLVLAEIDKLLRDGIDAVALARAKQRMRAAAVFARDSLQTGAQILGAALTTGQTVEDVEAWPERIQAVDGAAVLDAAREILRDPRSVTGILLPEDETG